MNVFGGGAYNELWKIRLKIEVTLIDEKIRGSYLIWFGNMKMRAINALVRKHALVQIKEMKRSRRGPKIKILEI